MTYKVIISMEKRPRGGHREITLEVTAYDEHIARQKALKDARDEFMNTHMDFWVKSCEVTES